MPPHLRFCRAAIGVQRIVRRELLRHVVVVVRGMGLEARGERVESSRFRREAARLRVGTAHDARQRVTRAIGQRVLVRERIERAPPAVVAQLGAWDVVENRALSRGDFHHVVRRHEQECRFTALVSWPCARARETSPTLSRLRRSTPRSRSTRPCAAA